MLNSVGKLLMLIWKLEPKLFEQLNGLDTFIIKLYWPYPDTGTTL